MQGLKLTGCCSLFHSHNLLANNLHALWRHSYVMGLDSWQLVHCSAVKKVCTASNNLWPPLELIWRWLSWYHDNDITMLVIACMMTSCCLNLTNTMQYLMNLFGPTKKGKSFLVPSLLNKILIRIDSLGIFSIWGSPKSSLAEFPHRPTTAGGWVAPYKLHVLQDCTVAH